MTENLYIRCGRMRTGMPSGEVPSVLLISHDASRTGAALCFGELLVALASAPECIRPLVLVTGSGPLVEEWRSTKLEVVVKEKRHAGSLVLKLFRRVTYLLAYLWLLAQCRPRLVYSNTIRNPMEVVLGRLAGARTLVHVHEGEHVIRQHALSLKFSSWFTSRYVCVSEYSANTLERYVHRKAAVILNGIQIGDGAGENDRVAPSGEWILGMVGGIQPNKGHHVAIEAIFHLRKEPRGAAARLRIYGETEDPDYRVSLNRLIGQLGVEENVEFCGSVAEPAAIYEKVDIVIVASFDESFSRVVLEAFRHERPVVASAVGGVLEIVKNEENGLLVRAGDAEGLATALRRLMTDPALAQRLVQGAAADVRRRFRLENTLARLRDEIDALLRRNDT